MLVTEEVLTLVVVLALDGAYTHIMWATLIGLLVLLAMMVGTWEAPRFSAQLGICGEMGGSIMVQTRQVQLLLWDLVLVML